MSELHSVNETVLSVRKSTRNYRAYNVRNMRNSGSRSSSEIQHFTSRLHIDISNTTLAITQQQNADNHSRTQLGTERIPLPVLLLVTNCSLKITRDLFINRNIHCYFLFSIDSFSRSKV